MFFFLSEFKEIFSFLNIFRYITFRAGMAAVTTFFLCLILGPIFIKKLKALNIGEVVKRKDCPHLDPFHKHKEGTPTMGGLIIIGSILISVLLWADLTNSYILWTLLGMLWLAILGGIDDYWKLSRRCEERRGMSKRRKFLWQLGFGLLLGGYVYLSSDVGTALYVPFFKDWVIYLGLLYVPFSALIIVGSSNAVNLTDGLDGLAIGCVLVVALTLAILSYITGNVFFTKYLFIPMVPGVGELTIFCSAIVGASLGFLWFNCHPASVFMGDVGSLPLGGVLGIITVFIKKELLLLLLGGVFVMEVLSVIIQVLSFKLFGKRVFKVSPIHHHFQMMGWHESQIIARFWILAIIFALITLTTLKIR